MHTARSLVLCDKLSRCCCIWASMQHQYVRNGGAASLLSWQARLLIIRLIITIDTAGVLQITPGRATRTGYLYNPFLCDTDYPHSIGLWIIRNISCRVKKNNVGTRSRLAFSQVAVCCTRLPSANVHCYVNGLLQPNSANSRTVLLSLKIRELKVVSRCSTSACTKMCV